MCDCHLPKQHFVALVCDSKSRTVMLWHVIGVKLNIVKKITGLEIMTQGFPQGSGQWEGGGNSKLSTPPSGGGHFGGEGDIFDMGGDIKNLQICK